MEWHNRKKLEIIIEAPLLGDVLEIFDTHGVTGYTVLPALQGRGHDGVWSRDASIGSAGKMLVVMCILSETRLDRVMPPLKALIAEQIGMLTLSDVKVMRPEHF